MRRRRRIKLISIVFASLAVGMTSYVLMYILDTKNSAGDKFQITDTSAESVFSDITYKTYDAKGKEVTLASQKIIEEKKDNYVFEKMTSNFQLSDGESGSVSSDKTKVIKDDKRPLHNEIFFARARKNAAQDRSVLLVHEDPSSGSDEANCEKEPLCSGLDKTICEFTGNVKFTTSSGLKMKTEKSIVDFNKKIAVGNTDILIEKDGLRLSSNEYHFDIDNGVAILTGNTRGFFYQRDVGSNNKTQELHRSSICCNKMVVKFMGKRGDGSLAKFIKSIDAIGNVKCTSTDYTLTAQKNMLYQRDVGSDSASLSFEPYASTQRDVGSDNASLSFEPYATTIVANSNVALTHKSDGSTMHCDKMVINLEGDNLSDTKSLKSLDAIGNAKYTSTDYTLTAQKNILYQRDVGSDNKTQVPRALPDRGRLRNMSRPSIIADSHVTLIYRKDGKTFDIKSGHMVASLDGKGSIKEIKATNSLIIKTADATIHSNSGVLRDNKIMAFGDVVISGPEGDVFGDTAVFDINTGGISVGKSSGIVTDGKKK